MLRRFKESPLSQERDCAMEEMTVSNSKRRPPCDNFFEACSSLSSGYRETQDPDEDGKELIHRRTHNPKPNMDETKQDQARTVQNHYQFMSTTYTTTTDTLQASPTVQSVTTVDKGDDYRSQTTSFDTPETAVRYRSNRTGEMDNLLSQMRQLHASENPPRMVPGRAAPPAVSAVTTTQRNPHIIQPEHGYENQWGLMREAPQRAAQPAPRPSLPRPLELQDEYWRERNVSNGWTEDDLATCSGNTHQQPPRNDGPSENVRQLRPDLVERGAALDDGFHQSQKDGTPSPASRRAIPPLTPPPSPVIQGHGPYNPSRPKGYY